MNVKFCSCGRDWKTQQLLSRDIDSSWLISSLKPNRVGSDPGIALLSTHIEEELGHELQPRKTYHYCIYLHPEQHRKKVVRFGHPHFESQRKVQPSFPSIESDRTLVLRKETGTPSRAQSTAWKNGAAGNISRGCRLQGRLSSGDLWALQQALTDPRKVCITSSPSVLENDPNHLPWWCQRL